MTTLVIYCQPGAKRSQVAGLFDGKVKIQLAAQPQDGEANQELIRFLSVALGVPKSSITLLSGQSSRIKRLEIAGAWEYGQIEERLLRGSSAESFGY